VVCFTPHKLSTQPRQQRRRPFRRRPFRRRHRQTRFPSLHRRHKPPWL